MSTQVEFTPTTRVSGNGFAVTALVLGIVGACFGLIPLTSFFALVLGFIGAIFGLVALLLALRGKRGRKVMSVVGLVLCGIAFALGVWGMTVLAQAADDFVESLEGISTSTAPPSTDSAQGGAASSSVVGFGQTVTYEDGTTVTVSAPETRRFASSSLGTGEQGMVVDVSVTAGSEVVTGATVMVNARQGESEVASVIALEENIDGMIENDIRPGRTVTETYAFDADDAGDLEVIVKPGFTYHEAVFTP